MTLFSEPTPRRERKRLIGGIVALAVFVGGIVMLAVVQAPYVIERPGPVVNVLGSVESTKVISVDGAASYPTKGALDLLTVNVYGNREASPSWGELLLAWLDPEQSIVPIDEVFPEQITTKQSEAESQAMMEQSQQDAIYVALTKLGYKIPRHVYVNQVMKNMPASGKFIAGDYVQSLNGHVPADNNELRALIKKYGDKPEDIVVLRKGKLVHLSVQPKKTSDGKILLGIFVGDKYDFPINVKLQLSDIGGPSGGMMFALGIYDTLTPGALTGGANIAGTGTIDSAGAIGPIGGIRHKLFGAKHAGAKYFLAPADNCDEVVGHVPDGIKLFKVSTFNQALTIVKAIGSKQDLTGFTTCTK